MAKVVHEHVAILDPAVDDVDELAVMRGMVHQMGLDHPEWKGLHWSTRFTVSTEMPTEFRIVITDPEKSSFALTKGDVVWAVVVISIIALLLASPILT